MSFRRSMPRLGLCALLGSLAMLASGRASADTTPSGAACDVASLTCAVGTASGMSAKIDKRLGTDIDSGWMDKGLIKIRTRFAIDPVKGSPLMALDMPRGTVVEASWPEKGQITLRPVAQAGASEGAMNIRYTLTPSLEASIYGVNVNYDANQLINMIPGAAFNYDAKASAPLLPWGWAGAQATAPAPALDKSTIFSLPFSDLGVDPGLVEGTLSIQAATKPTFKYTTKQIKLDSGVVTAADGTTKIPAIDADALDLSAQIQGELTMTGTIDMRPVVKIDSVDGYPTFGLVKFSFSAVTKQYSGTPTPVAFEHTTIHIPLPNIKVPTRPFSVGTAKAGGQVEKTVSIDSTGELEGMIEVTSSDPQFVVPSGKIKIGSKSKYDLKVAFKPSSDAPASATITVRSNDPDSPEQTFKVAANGAKVGDEGEDESEEGNGRDSLDGPAANEGCAASTSSKTGSIPGLGALGLGLAVAVVVRRRRAR